jgi:hypothetical protein
MKVGSAGAEVAVMSKADTMLTFLEVFRDHDIPRFELQRGRLTIKGIPLAGGYRVITTLRGMRCRFTALLYLGDTTHLVFYEREVDGNWNEGRIETHAKLVCTEFLRQFLGFIYSVIETESEVPRIQCGVDYDQRSAQRLE